MTQPIRNQAPEVYICAGLPGTGKSTFARSLAPDEQTYHKNTTKWWDGYQCYVSPDVSDGAQARGHKLVIFDDYAGCLTWTDWKLLCDRAPYIAEVKGSTINITSPIIVFTTNKDPMKWYKWQHDPSASVALQRRVTHWMIFEKGLDETFNHIDYGSGEKGWKVFNEHLSQLFPINVNPVFDQ